MTSHPTGDDVRGERVVDPTVRNPAVAAAYAKREYVTKDGTKYTRGMDGWFADAGSVTTPDGDVVPAQMLVRHPDMAKLIAREAEEGEHGSD